MVLACLLFHRDGHVLHQTSRGRQPRQLQLMLTSFCSDTKGVKKKENL